MSTSASFASAVLAAPRPVLFLDACIFLDIIRAADRKNLVLPAVTSALNLRDRMNDEPPACHLVGSAILTKELDDNKGPACQLLDAAVTGCDAVLTIGSELTVIDSPPPTVSLIKQAVIKLADDLIRLTTVLPPDPDCLQRAFERVLQKRQPARDGKIKDGYMLEQCLALCRQLRTGGFGNRLIFCSSNTSDFTKPQSTQFDQDIAGDASAVGLDYFTSLSAAVGSLRLIPTSRV